MIENKLERPLPVKLILLFNVLHVTFIIISMLSGYGGFVGLLFIIALYYGLWKMKKDWMVLVIFAMIVSTVYYIFLIFAYLDVIAILIVILNIISVVWLFKHRNIFIEPEKGKSALGSKKEWMIVGIIILGLIVFFILLFSGVFGF